MSMPFREIKGPDDLERFLLENQGIKPDDLVPLPSPYDDWKDEPIPELTEEQLERFEAGPDGCPIGKVRFYPLWSENWEPQMNTDSLQMCRHSPPSGGLFRTRYSRYAVLHKLVVGSGQSDTAASPPGDTRQNLFTEEDHDDS